MLQINDGHNIIIINLSQTSISETVAQRTLIENARIDERIRTNGKIDPVLTTKLDEDHSGSSSPTIISTDCFFNHSRHKLRSLLFFIRPCIFRTYIMKL